MQLVHDRRKHVQYRAPLFLQILQSKGLLIICVCWASLAPQVRTTLNCAWKSQVQHRGRTRRRWETFWSRFKVPDHRPPSSPKSMRKQGLQLPPVILNHALLGGGDRPGSGRHLVLVSVWASSEKGFKHSSVRPWCKAPPSQATLCMLPVRALAWSETRQDN